MIFLARNGAEVTTLSLFHTLSWLELKDSRGVRFLAALCCSVVMQSAELHYSCSPELAALSTALGHRVLY